METIISVILLLLSVAGLNGSPPKKECLVQGPITLPDGKNITGSRNVGGCTCKEVFDQEFNPNVQDDVGVTCNKDGSWSLKQDRWQFAYCVDKQGNQVSEVVVQEHWSLQCDPVPRMPATVPPLRPRKPTSRRPSAGAASHS
ncbi:uncharacterized protein LOC129600281 [Paramacrobiotus metropolitanus]|uniref:uncharacterized protein LOC129600281 n=1 Tax=Paramacrobiotus metropolitanus TaxID=2943436 RepID=UPI002445CEA1|nr:uncharacterized protein LOC129600281 [Paramacrobiotus metropolitanus]